MAVIERANKIYRDDDKSELVRYLRCCRCGLMDELHENQRKLTALISSSESWKSLNTEIDNY